ncbi:MAG: type IV toxin-antitoxin system AbiEi family antitoxin domain-containing protein [Geodermatophilaceae bacterium]|nr:type IV toxin-antitoxin system AbiEi family antitoxin domain-containing protein [Geodermatophilaceae bacterium]
MNDLLVAKARVAGGFFTAADALASGYDRQSLSRLSSKGTVVRIGRGAYAARSAFAGASHEEQHRLAARAVVHRFAGRVAASHYSALTELGLPVWHATLDRVHVARTSNGCNRCSTAVSVHRDYGGLPL